MCVPDATECRDFLCYTFSMKQLKNLVLAGIGVVLLVVVILYAIIAPRAVVHAPDATSGQSVSSDTEQILSVGSDQNNSYTVQITPSPASAINSEIAFVGPRENISKDAPSAYGFWSFAVPINGVISRSGQPLLSEFKWLKDNGWKGDIDLRHDGEYSDPSADDSKLPGFKDLGFNYLHVDILDGHPPTDEEAQQILTFIMSPANQPVHVHCRGGYGRTGTVIALYRYAVQNWPLDKAVAESRLFHGGISDAQLKWLTSWAGAHPAGSFGK
jgi:protein tyrosine phosphatase (PTP) superfamily phosphohydrolase (DUF442 family)